MRTRNLIVTFLFASLVGILAIACSAKTPSKVSVDKDVSVAIYSTTEREGAIDTVSPCLLTETVHISELLRYPDDNEITVPFNFKDIEKYAQITETNLDKRIAISINGEIVSTPVIKMKISDGACSVLLSKEQIAKYFPNIHVEAYSTTVITDTNSSGYCSGGFLSLFIAKFACLIGVNFS